MVPPWAQAPRPSTRRAPQRGRTRRVPSSGLRSRVCLSSRLSVCLSHTHNPTLMKHLCLLWCRHKAGSHSHARQCRRHVNSIRGKPRDPIARGRSARQNPASPRGAGERAGASSLVAICERTAHTPTGDASAPQHRPWGAPSSLCSVFHWQLRAHGPRAARAAQTELEPLLPSKSKPVSDGQTPGDAPVPVPGGHAAQHVFSHEFSFLWHRLETVFLKQTASLTFRFSH